MAAMNDVHRGKGGKHAKTSLENRRATAGLRRRRDRVGACRSPRRRADRASPIRGRRPLPRVCMPYLAIAHQIAARLPARSQGIYHRGTSRSALGQRQDSPEIQGTGTCGGRVRQPDSRARSSGSRRAFALLRGRGWRAVQENVGAVELGAGWRVTWPAAYRQQNSSASWSAVRRRLDRICLRVLCRSPARRVRRGTVACRRAPSTRRSPEAALRSPAVTVAA